MRRPPFAPALRSDYRPYMNQLLDKALKAVSELPEEEQNEIARLMIDLARPDPTVEPLDPAHRKRVLRGLEQARRGEFATEAEVDEAFRRFQDNPSERFA